MSKGVDKKPLIWRSPIFCHAKSEPVSQAPEMRVAGRVLQVGRFVVIGYGNLGMVSHSCRGHCAMAPDLISKTKDSGEPAFPSSLPPTIAPPSHPPNSVGFARAPYVVTFARARGMLSADVKQACSVLHASQTCSINKVLTAIECTFLQSPCLDTMTQARPTAYLAFVALKDRLGLPIRTTQLFFSTPIHRLLNPPRPKTVPPAKPKTKTAPATATGLFSRMHKTPAHLSTKT